MTEDDNLLEWARFEAMRQVIEPARNGGTPDLAVDFDGGLAVILVMCKAKVAAIPPERRHEFFVSVAEGAIEWSRENGLEPLLDSSQAWLRRLTGGA